MTQTHTDEEIVEEFKKLLIVHQSNMQIVDMLDRPNVQIRMFFVEDWLRTTLTQVRKDAYEEGKLDGAAEAATVANTVFSKMIEKAREEAYEDVREWLGGHTVWDNEYVYLRKSRLIDAFIEKFLK
jgi:hypothetical protein